MKITFNGKYDCKLTTRTLVTIGDELGRDPLNELFNEDIPKIGTLVTIFYHSLKACNNDITLDKAYDILDEYFEGEGDIMSLSKFIYQLYKASGLVKLPDIPEDIEEGTEKN